MSSPPPPPDAAAAPAAIGALKVRHFRCFEAYENEFAAGLNLIVGPNARGKTSLLEAACILLRLQSPRTSRLLDVIQHDRRGLVVDGYFGARHLQFYYAARRKKLALDSVEQANPAEYLQIGRIVYFSTSDIEIVRGGSEARRGFLDSVAEQRTAGYRRSLREYERALRSRNALLKAPSPRWREIDAFDAPLLAAGAEITRVRAALSAELQPHVAAAHHAISGGAAESLHLEYRPGTGEDFAAALAASREEDARLRQTCVGPHRDELGFVVQDRDSRFASEGQQRTLVLALRLGAARLLHEHFTAPPVLLLDDIFGELDFSRRAALLAALPAASQKVITLTNLAWVPEGAEAHVIRLA
jgi:DNA replication and repair protein RecF